MKKVSITLFLLAAVVSSFAQQQFAAVATPVSPVFTRSDAAIFNWSRTSFDFGTIKKDTPVTNEFTFVNDGDVALVITSVQASCGCTVAEYSKDPIAPGSTGYVKATYNAAKLGAFSKTISINANTEQGVVILTIKGEVVE